MSSYISAAEWRWLFVVSLLIIALTSLPVVVGFAMQTPETVFNGATFDRQDFAVHLASMQQGLRGEWAYRLLFTTEPSSAKPVKMAYIALGHVARWLNLDLVLTYHLARVVLGLILMVMIYRLMVVAFQSITLRRIAFLLATTASGIGTFLLVIDWLPDPGISPVDFWLVDMYVFFSMATFPHFEAVAILILAMAISYLNYINTGKVSHWLIAVIAGVLIIPIQPFSIALGDLLAGGSVIASWRKEGRARFMDLLPLAGLIAAQAPLLYINTRVFTGDSLWQGFAAQNITLSPPPIYYLLGIGFLGPLAIWGAWLAWRRRDSVGVMALCWAIGALVLCFAPSLLQRRFSADLTIPFSLLATLALGFGFLPWLNEHRGWTRWGPLVLLLIVVAAVPSSLYLSAGSALYVSKRPEPLFDPVPLVRAVDWLGEQADVDDALLASPRSGLLIPARVGLRTFVGHPIETINYNHKAEQVAAFYDPGGMTMVERVQFLSESGCNWVIFGPFEGGEGGTFEPGSLPILQLEYEGEGVRLFRILLDIGAEWRQTKYQ